MSILYASFVIFQGCFDYIVWRNFDMTEYDKMHNGMIYDCYQKKLEKYRKKAIVFVTNTMY